MPAGRNTLNRHETDAMLQYSPLVKEMGITNEHLLIDLKELYRIACVIK